MEQVQNPPIPEFIFYIYDHLGNTRVTYSTTHDGNAVVYTMEGAVDYFPYGKVLREYHNGAVEKYLSTQHERDQETGLDYRGARFYDADVGRFLSLDPLAADYPNLSDYVYVSNNPLIFVDPDGREIRVYYKEGDEDNYVVYNEGKYFDEEGNEFTQYENIEFLKNTMEALQYLSNSRTATEIIEELSANDGHIVNLVDAKDFFDARIGKLSPGEGNGKSTYSSYSNTVFWNPRTAIKWSSPDYKQNPAIGLIHEFSHAKQHKTNPDKFSQDLRTPDKDYTNKEEKRTITFEETTVIEELRQKGYTDGTTPRKTHIGQIYPSISITSAKPKK